MLTPSPTSSPPTSDKEFAMAAPHQSSRITRRQFLTGSTAALSAAPFIVPNRLFAQPPVASLEASPVAAGPQLYVSSTDVQFDEAFEIGVSGLQPGDEVTIRSDFTDSFGRDWSADATYIAEGQGEIDCSSLQPISGTFLVADSMAFIWAAAGTAPFYVPTLLGPETVKITAVLDGVEIGEATIQRTMLPGPDTSEFIHTPELIAYYYEPLAGSSTPAPAMIVLGGSDGGLSSYMQLTAALLASHGYAALVVA